MTTPTRATPGTREGSGGVGKALVERFLRATRKRSGPVFDVGGGVVEKRRARRGGTILAARRALALARGVGVVAGRCSTGGGSSFEMFVMNVRAFDAFIGADFLGIFTRTYEQGSSGCGGEKSDADRVWAVDFSLKYAVGSEVVADLLLARPARRRLCTRDASGAGNPHGGRGFPASGMRMGNLNGDGDKISYPCGYEYGDGEKTYSGGSSQGISIGNLCGDLSGDYP
ncbi:hypothetical protein Scep_005034 [Stephania cephalantha]|uniref:Uncharacterized protein n=1 Tax=Stephania cephalantha TaxID=152367 RepID=A0AAP0KW31_9MAGN